jgi:nucleoside-diphosphate-sugar epimerase
MTEVFVVAGASGRVGHPLAERLLSAGHEVRVVGRNARILGPLSEQGAPMCTSSGAAVELQQRSTEYPRPPDADACRRLELGVGHLLTRVAGEIDDVLVDEGACRRIPTVA